MVGMTKAYVYPNASGCKDLVAFMVFDTKPVYFLSTVVDSLFWMKKERKVYDNIQKKSIKLPFLRTNVQDVYNNGMNKVDIVDQVCRTYRIDRWCRNHKWWMAFWF